MTLERDFWLFRSGQLASVIGDACSGIAIAWWILEKTGSAAQISAVLAPAMLVQICLTPLAIGALMLILSPAPLLIPLFSNFLRCSHNEAKTFLQDHYKCLH